MRLYLATNLEGVGLRFISPSLLPPQSCLEPALSVATSVASGWGAVG